MLMVGFIVIGIGIGRAFYMERREGTKNVGFPDSYSAAEVSDTTEAK